MKRTKDMTSAIATKPFEAEELVPGQCLIEAHQTWSKMSSADKWKLGLIIGFDQVLRIEMRYLNG